MPCYPQYNEKRQHIGFLRGCVEKALENVMPYKKQLDWFDIERND